MNPPPRALAYGSSATLVETDHPQAAFELVHSWQLQGLYAELDDAVPGESTLLLIGVAAGDRLVENLLTALQSPATGKEESSPLVEIPTVYAGEDLEMVAGNWGMAVAEAVEFHQRIEFRVAFLGFSPGFAYMKGLPADMSVPRLETPRTTVPAGSVALAADYCGIYPGASPGGWRLIGRTETRVWDPGSQPPSLFAPGTRVRFVSA